MNKKLVLAAALVFGVTGLILANSVKAQDANSDNSTTNTDTTNTDNSTANAS